MSAPAVVIRLEIEAMPKIFPDVVSESEYERLIDWLESHEELRMLLVFADQLREGMRAT
jgi:hypothetical protein